MLSFFSSVFFMFGSTAHADNMLTWATGKWIYDVESSMNRCERLLLHDCKNWNSVTESERLQLKEQYREGFLKMNGTVFSLSSTVMSMREQNSEIKIIDSDNWSHLVVEVTDSKEIIVLLRERENVFCFSERGSKSDSMCFRSMK